MTKNWTFENTFLCTLERRNLMVSDFISAACFLNGKLFYFMNFENLVPDIVTSGKSLGGGKASISAFTSKEIFFNKKLITLELGLGALDKNTIFFEQFSNWSTASIAFGFSVTPLCITPHRSTTKVS